MDIKKITAIGKEVIGLLAIVATATTACGWINDNAKKGVERKIDNIKDAAKK